MNAKAPPPQPRPKFAAWLFERGVTNAAAGEALGCSGEQVRRINLPFGDAKRQVPGQALMLEIVRYTGGEITAGDFYPAVPEILGDIAQPVAAVA